MEVAFCLFTLKKADFQWMLNFNGVSRVEWVCQTLHRKIERQEPFQSEDTYGLKKGEQLRLWQGSHFLLEEIWCLPPTPPHPRLIGDLFSVWWVGDIIQWHIWASSHCSEGPKMKAALLDGSAIGPLRNLRLSCWDCTLWMLWSRLKEVP